MTCLQLEMNAVCFSCNITFGAHECSNSECIKVQSQISSKPVNCKVDMTGIYNDTCSIMKPLNESGQNASVYFYNQSVVIAVGKHLVFIQSIISFYSIYAHHFITYFNQILLVFIHIFISMFMNYSLMIFELFHQSIQNIIIFPYPTLNT